MATKVLSVRASEEEIEQWRQAATDNGSSLATWMHDVVAEVAAAMGYLPGAKPLDGQLTLAGENPPEFPPAEPPPPEWIPEPPAPEPQPTSLPPQFGGRPPDDLGVSTLKPTCQAAHLHWRLERGQTCQFCGGTP